MEKKAIIREILQKASEDSRIVGVSIFGSYLESGEKARDVDVCLFLNEESKNLSSLEISKIRLEYVSEIGDENLDLQIFQQLPMYIKKRVVGEGKIILEKDYDALYTTYIETLKEYSFYEKVYREYLQGVRNG